MKRNEEKKNVFSRVGNRVVRFGRFVWKHKIVVLVMLIAVVGFNPIKNTVANLLLEKKENITLIQVTSTMEGIAETAAYEKKYTDTIEDIEQWNIGKLKIPFTKKMLELSYSGTIKAGYQNEDIEYVIDKDLHEVRVWLPKAEILSHEMRSEVINESDTILNHLSAEEVINLESDIYDTEEEKALEEGLLEKAERKMKKDIEESLREFDYEVVFK